MSDNDVPHLALPLRVVAGMYVTTQQDTDEEAADCVRVILSFMKDERAELPEFGIVDPTFQLQPIDVEGIANAISNWEPRVDALIETTDEPDGTTTVSIQVTLPTSDEPEEMI